MKIYKLAYFVSHPIQYQAPMLREVAKHPNIDLNVFFQSDLSTKQFKDEGFGVEIKWDIDLLNGYKYEFLKILKKDKNKLRFFSPINYGIYNIIKRKKWDAVWFHGYNHHTILWSIFLCKILKIPFFMRMESNLFVSHKGRFIKDFFIKFIIKNSSGLLYIGKANKEYYLKYGANRKKLFEMPYTVDNDFFQTLSNQFSKNINFQKKRLGLKSDLPIILFASKLIQRKNPLDLLEAFKNIYKNKKIINAYLLFIGDGILRRDLETEIKKFNFQDNIKILGFKNQNELPLYYSLCDVFVLPSSKEPYGLVVNEVLNCQKPIISTSEVGASHDLILHNQNGFIIKPKNIEELSFYLKKFIDDRGLSKKMGKKSLEIIKNWNFKKNVDGIIEALKSLD
jgi:glycosyltransferase involved in cell wall biosynthesis